jgi:predicted flap endonuclease-1-like 5' DNA nuclease
MSTLLTEILISLVVIAVIGGIIGWLVRGAHMNNRQADSDQDLRQSRKQLEQARVKIERLESSMKQMNQLRKTEREGLEGRIRELEPLFELVEKRDGRIRELNSKLEQADTERKADLDQQQFSLSTRALLGDDDESEVARLQNELRLANRQRESAINRYQNQVRQIEDLENAVKEKTKLVAELNQRIEADESSMTRELETLRARAHQLANQSKDKDDKIALMENKKQYESRLLEARAEQAEQRLVELQSRIEELNAAQESFREQEEELNRQLAELQEALQEKEDALNRVQESSGRTRSTRPAKIHAMSATTPPPLTPANKDQLQALKGIGPNIEVKLKNLGIETLEQIAALEESDIKRITESIPSFEGNLKRFEWIENARRLTQESPPSRVNRQSS